MGRTASAGQRTSSARSVEGKPPRRRPFASMSAAMKYLDGRANMEKVRPAAVRSDTFKLDRMRALAEALGNPQNDYDVIHVAGSKGKGSVCEMVASTLGACGCSVGLFTSPHLIDVRERIRIGGELVDKKLFLSVLAQCRAAADEIADEHGDATYFELITAAGFLAFSREAIDVAVVEVGLGGRLDCTNIVEPTLCGISSIQLEHTAILGDTLEKIAAEKAGIMKPGVPVFGVPQQPEVLEVFRSRAAEVGAPLMVLGEEIEFSSRFEASPELGPHTRVSVTTPRSTFEHLPVPLLGEHQATNCGLALALVGEYDGGGVNAGEREVALGLSRTPRNGRLEQAWSSPRIYVDGAHTPESIRGVIQGVGAHVRYDSMVVIFGCASDKDIDGMLAEVSRGADKIIFTAAAENPRSADPRELNRRLGETTEKMSQTCASVKDAINTAVRAVGRDDLVLITGSFHVAGEAKALLHAARSRPRSS